MYATISHWEASEINDKMIETMQNKLKSNINIFKIFAFLTLF